MLLRARARARARIQLRLRVRVRSRLWVRGEGLFGFRRGSPKTNK